MEFDVIVDTATEGMYIERVKGKLSPHLIAKIKRAQELLKGNEDNFEGVVIKRTPFHEDGDDVSIEEIYEDEEGEKVNDMVRLSGRPKIEAYPAGVLIVEQSKYTWEQTFEFFVNV